MKYLHVALLLIATLDATPGFCERRITIPVYGSVKKIVEGFIGTVDTQDVRRSFIFELPKDARYEYSHHWGTRKWVGDVTEEIKFFPNKENVSRVELTLTAKTSSEHFGLALYTFGTDSEQHSTYMFQFIRHPTDEELEKDHLFKLEKLIEIAKSTEDNLSTRIRWTYGLAIKSYLEMTPEFARWKAYGIFHGDYLSVVRYYKQQLLATLEEIKKVPGLHEKLSPLITTVLQYLDGKVQNQRDWFAPVAKRYGFTVETLLDTPMESAPSEPSGSDEEFITKTYREIFNREPTEAVFWSFRNLKTVPGGRQGVIDKWSRTAGAIINRHFQTYLKRYPTESEFQQYLDQVVQGAEKIIRRRIDEFTEINKHAPTPEDCAGYCDQNAKSELWTSLAEDLEDTIMKLQTEV